MPLSIASLKVFDNSVVSDTCIDNDIARLTNYAATLSISEPPSRSLPRSFLRQLPLS